MVRSVVQALADFLVEDACHLCGRPQRAGTPPPGRLRAAVAAPAVLSVLGTFTLTSHPLCSRCARRLVEAEGCAALPSGNGAPVPVVAPFYTNATLLEIVHAVKFGRVTCLIPGLSAAIATALAAREALGSGVVLVPVPLDRAGHRRRGFNQAERIAREIARATGWEVAARALVKPRPTPPQSLMSRNERTANVRGAFLAGPDRVAGRDVVLVDDLVTTGATASVCVRVLEDARARIEAVACAGRAL